MQRSVGLSPAAAVLIVGLCATLAAAAEPASTPAADRAKNKFPGLGDPGQLIEIKLEETGDFLLRGPEARRQLLVTGKYLSGQVRDLTHTVALEAEPADAVRIEEGGLIVPLKDGPVTITAAAKDGIKTSSQLVVEGFGRVIPIDFLNQVVPIFTKQGCNSGMCHGKSSGQGGFRLSLLGFYPDEDYDFLVKEDRGRRLFPAAADRSLVLLKATNAVPHGGGRRLKQDLLQYQIIRQWIAQGMPFVRDPKAVVTRIETVPATRPMDRRTTQQLRVLAHYASGNIEDVTRLAQFDPSDGEMAGVSATGLVTTLDLTGDVGVMARYQGHVALFRATIPLGADVGQFPEPANFIDSHVFAKLKNLGIPLSQPADDAAFLRRVTVDIAGRLPTIDEARQFAADSNPKKRDALIDRLLDSGDYADYFANKWSALLRNQRINGNYTAGAFALHEWIRDNIRQNTPYDRFVRTILTASGEMSQNPPVVWYRSVTTPEQQLEDTAQLFLGMRLQCARCHHHPFERWSQQDYYSFAAFFARVGRKTSRTNNQIMEDVRIFHNRGVAQATNPRTGQAVKPAGLGATPVEIDAEDDPRHVLVDWMVAPSNPFFARALVNRYWKHFFSRGIVEPEDDLRITNPPSNDPLLDALASSFVSSKFDTKELIRTICRSKTYQLGSAPNAANLSDKQNFSSYYPKRLSAEVLYDALAQATDVPTGFGGMPAGVRAVQLPDSGVANYFLDVFGRPKGASACECERVNDANLAQSLHLLNSNEVQGKLSAGNGRAAALARDEKRPLNESVVELYLAVYSRPPIPEEMEVALSHLKQSSNRQQAFEDILWALLNTKEFLFNH